MVLSIMKNHYWKLLEGYFFTELDFEFTDEYTIIINKNESDYCTFSDNFTQFILLIFDEIKENVFECQNEWKTKEYLTFCIKKINKAIVVCEKNIKAINTTDFQKSKIKELYEAQQKNYSSSTESLTWLKNEIYKEYGNYIKGGRKRNPPSKFEDYLTGIDIDKIQSVLNVYKNSEAKKIAVLIYALSIDPYNREKIKQEKFKSAINSYFNTSFSRERLYYNLKSIVVR